MSENQEPFDNPFDNISSGIEFDPKKIKKQQDLLNEEYRKRDHLIHKVFAQNPDGKELLEHWIEKSLLRIPVVVKGAEHDPFDIGIVQGTHDFIRNILLTCEKVEKGDV